MTKYDPVELSGTLLVPSSIHGFPIPFSRYGAACLFDETLARKPTYYGVASILSAAAASAGTASVVSSASQTPTGMTTSYIPLSTTTASSISSEVASSAALAVSTLISILSTSVRATLMAPSSASSSSAAGVLSITPSSIAPIQNSSVVSVPGPATAASTDNEECEE